MKKTQILILTISHIWYDSRVYYKICKSLLKKDVSIYLITGNPAYNADSSPEDDLTIDIISKDVGRLKLISYFIKKGLELKPDVVICIEPLTLYAGYKLKKKLGCRLVYDCHEFYVDAFRERHSHLVYFYKRYEDKFARSADAIITVNEILVEKFAQLNKNVYLCANFPSEYGLRYSGVINDEVGTLGGSIDNASSSTPPDSLTPNTQHPTPPECDKPFDLIYIGGISFARGLKVYLQTVKLFKDQKKPFKFLLVGVFFDRTAERFCFDFIKHHQLEDYVTYKAFVPNEEAMHQIKKAKIGIFFADIEKAPRYNKGINIKVFEYMSQAVPVVINKLEMLTPFVETAQCGWSIDYSPTALYDFLDNTLKNKALLTEKGNCGREYLIKNCLWENQEETLYKAIFGE